jgi:beta-mannosidase
MVQESIECIEHTEICNDTNKGLTYFFRINGVEVYTKGGNLVPMDYYPSRMNQKEELEWLIYSAKQSNLNLLRIWGGGIYMPDWFYAYADEMGILIWHDLSFSCKFYPMVDKDFLENSK